MAQIRGLDALRRQLRALPDQIRAEGMKSINAAVDLMIADAKANAPEDLSRLINSISKENSTDGWAVVFFVGEPHGAFQEFGTVKRVSVPAELESEAQKFKGYQTGSFEEFLEDLKGWCLRKGIDVSAAYPIAISILNRGVAPQPYFYPAYLKYKDSILVDIKDRIQRLWR